MKTKKTNALFVTLLSLLCILAFSFCAGAADSTEQTEGIFTYTVENDQATLTKIDYKGLDEIHIPETLGGYEVTKISDKVMADETGIFGDDPVTTVYVPKTVTYIPSSAFDLADLGYIVVDEDNPNYSSDDNGVLFDKDKTKLIKAAGCFSGGTYTVPDGVETIGSCAFMHCLFVKEIILPDSVNTLGFEAFFDAQSLESVDVPEGVTKISQMCFAACPSLKYISLPSTLTTIFNSAFTECYSIEKIVIPEGVTELGVYAFENDTALEYVYLPSTLTKIESGALGNCTKITDICYGGSQEDWEKITINTEAYYGDRPVIVDTANIRFNVSPDPYKTIDFENQNGIMTVYGSGKIPTYDENGWHYWDQNKDDVTTLIIDGISSIGSNSFCDFPSLTNVIVSDSITFEPNAFVNCPKLENVIIFGDSSFESTAFASCAEQMRVFENSGSSHSFSQSNENINVIPFSYDGSVLSFSGDVQLDSYEFFDTLAAFCLEYDNIEKVKFENLTFEDIEMYYIPDGGASLKTFENNTLKNGEIYPSVTGSKTDTITFNELISGMADSSITHFYLIASDESQSNVQNTQVKVSDSIREIIARAIRWIVTLLNKLFSIISRLK